MGEVVDIKKDLTTRDLTIQQKISVIWESLIADSKLVGKRKKMEEERRLQERNNRFDSLKDGILASLVFHLQENKTFEEYNQKAVELQLAIDRVYKDVLEDVLKSHELNIYDWGYVDIDSDLINSFGDLIPIVIFFRQREVKV